MPKLRPFLPLTLIALASLGLTGCAVQVGGSKVEVKELEKKAEKIFFASVKAERGVDLTGRASIDCPGDEVEVKENKDVVCMLKADDGSSLEVTITFIDDEGSFTIKGADQLSNAPEGAETPEPPAEQPTPPNDEVPSDEAPDSSGSSQSDGTVPCDSGEPINPGDASYDDQGNPNHKCFEFE